MDASEHHARTAAEILRRSNPSTAAVLAQQERISKLFEIRSSGVEKMMARYEADLLETKKSIIRSAGLHNIEKTAADQFAKSPAGVAAAAAARAAIERNATAIALAKSGAGAGAAAATRAEIKRTADVIAAGQTPMLARLMETAATWAAARLALPPIQIPQIMLPGTMAAIQKLSMVTAGADIGRIPWEQVHDLAEEVGATSFSADELDEALAQDPEAAEAAKAVAEALIQANSFLRMPDALRWAMVLVLMCISVTLAGCVVAETDPADVAAVVESVRDSGVMSRENADSAGTAAGLVLGIVACRKQRDDG